MGSVAAYNVGGACGTAEITQALSELGGAAATVSFTPVLAPMPRGILATCTARLTGPDVSTAALRAAIASGYAGSPFACLLPEGRWPATASVTGSNGVHLQAAADERAGRAIVVAAIDNLGKGAASQARTSSRAANLMLGLARGNTT